MTTSVSILIILFFNYLYGLCAFMYMVRFKLLEEKIVFVWYLYSQVAQTTDYHISLTLFNFLFLLKHTKTEMLV